mgnify:CR=1 FL=1
MHHHHVRGKQTLLLHLGDQFKGMRLDLDEEISEGTTELKLIKPPLQQDILQLK